VNVSDDQAEIIEFKTGEPREEHELQVQIYSLLWMRDPELNPFGKPLRALILSYRHRDVPVAPLAEAEAAAFEELVVRHRAWIYNIAVRMLYHPQDAEDATQEILVKALYGAVLV
jgi:sigma-70-like protein